MQTVQKLNSYSFKNISFHMLLEIFLLTVVINVIRVLPSSPLSFRLKGAQVPLSLELEAGTLPVLSTVLSQRPLAPPPEPAQ